MLTISRSPDTEEHIISIPKEHENGLSVGELALDFEFVCLLNPVRLRAKWSEGARSRGRMPAKPG